MFKKTFSQSLYLLIFMTQTEAFAQSPTDHFRQQAFLDSQPYMNLIGKLTYTVDGAVPPLHETTCKLGRALIPEEFYSPNDSEDLASFSMMTNFNSDPKGFPASQFYILSSGRYENVSGPAGQAQREIAPNGSVIYTSPTSHSAGMWESCGSWGHISKPILNRQGELIFGQNFVQFSFSYRCGFFGKEHKIVQTCKF